MSAHSTPSDGSAAARHPSGFPTSAFSFQVADPSFSGNTGESSRRSSMMGAMPASSARDGVASRLQEEAEAEAKRRKVVRACDVCRRKKIKCDGPMNSNSANKCAHCEEFGMDCTYVEAAKRRGPPKGYIEVLEQRCGRLERLLHDLYPAIDFDEFVGPVPDKDDFDAVKYALELKDRRIPVYPSIKPFYLPLDHPDRLPNGTSPNSTNPPAAPAPPVRLHVLGPEPWKTFDQDPKRPPPPPDSDLEEAQLHSTIAHAMSKLDMKDTPWRFHGKASPHYLTMTLNELKYERQGRNMLDEIKQTRRQEYWQTPEWEIVIANEGLRAIDYTVWPEDDLATTLIDSYFDHVDFHLPLLSKPLFKKQYANKLWKTSHEFTKVCLMVFANGARFVDDQRIYWPKDMAMTEEGKQRLRSDTDGTLKYSAGWIYMLAVLKMGRSMMQGPNLFDFQTQVLVCSFLYGSAVPHLSWIISGMGLRAAQEIGIHVRSILLHAAPIERALYNRAFWCLYHIDRLNCAAIGRSVAIQDTDFDADYPIAVDDEYWDTGDPATSFVQPATAGPSRVAAFVHTLKLDHIIGAALRTIYAVNKLPEHRADPAMARSVVVELDSALNSWADAVPDGLRWDPTRADQKLFEQSAVLYAHYYHCQILIHRPFIPTNRHPGTVGLPSLAICANAARSICNILDAVLRRGRQYGNLPGHTVNYSFMLPAWVAAIVLLISLYSGKQQPGERERVYADVKKCLAAMREMELIWRQAGKLTDFLTQMVKDMDKPSDEPSPPQGTKRAHETPAFSATMRPGHLSTPSGTSQSRTPASVPSNTTGTTGTTQSSRGSTPPPVWGLPSCPRLATGSVGSASSAWKGQAGTSPAALANLFNGSPQQDPYLSMDGGSSIGVNPMPETLFDNAFMSQLPGGPLADWTGLEGMQPAEDGQETVGPDFWAALLGPLDNGNGGDWQIQN